MPILIHDHLGGHASQLEQVDFLSVQFEHAGFGVGQADEGQVMFFANRRQRLWHLPGQPQLLRPAVLQILHSPGATAPCAFGRMVR